MKFQTNVQISRIPGVSLGRVWRLVNGSHDRIDRGLRQGSFRYLALSIDCDQHRDRLRNLGRAYTMLRTPANYTRSSKSSMRLPTFTILFLLFETFVGDDTAIATSARIELVSVLIPYLSSRLAAAS